MKKTAVSIILFFGVVLLASIVFWKIDWRRQPAVKEAKTHLSAQPFSGKKTAANVFVNFNPHEKTVYKGEEFKVGVLIESKARIVGADLNFNFNPAILNVEKVAPGRFFSKPLEIKKLIDTEKGDIFYSVGSFEPRAGKGVLVELVLKAKAAGTAELSLAKDSEIAVEETDKVKTNLPISGRYAVLK